jgi:bifunctional DNA-binding transcriptional regulator/antitoxin component of YhaV-PrlF toxin-antitoxin module
MNDLPQPVEVNLGRQGPVVMPASLRRALGFEERDALVAQQELGRLLLEKPRRIRQRLKERYDQVHGERKLVDELIAERRLEGTKGN